MDDQLKQLIDLRKAVKDKASKNTNFAVDFKWPKFLMIMSAFFAPGSYGARIQRRLIDELGCESVPQKIDQGDAKYKDLWIEIKVSFVDTNGDYNLHGLKFWQSVDCYLVVLVPSDFDAIVFVIPRDDMEVLVKKHGNNSHITNNSNQKMLYKWTIKPSVLFQLDKYRV